MLPKLLTSLFGSRNDRLLKQYRRVVERINALEPQFEKLSDTELRAMTDTLRQRAQTESLDALLPEAFAVCRTAAKRVLGMLEELANAEEQEKKKLAEQEKKKPLASLPRAFVWWRFTDSNRGPVDYDSIALTD